MGVLLVAVAPGLFLLSQLYLRDRFEREPLGLVVKTFSMGLLVAVPVLLIDALVVIPLGEALGLADERGPWNAYVTAALVEESMKMWATFLIAYRSVQWNEQFDGIVYAGAAALGFATIENILYVTELGLGVGILRALFSVPGHALFGIIMGYYLGLAKVTESPRKRRQYWLLALVMPVLMHGTFNQLLFLVEPYPIVVVIFLAFDVLLWTKAVRRMSQAQKASPFQEK